MASDWMPIDTAPKDGTPFLAGVWVIIDSTPVFDMHVTWWSSQWGFNGNANDANPTHWQALPPPPRLNI